MDKEKLAIIIGGIILFIVIIGLSIPFFLVIRRRRNQPQPIAPQPIAPQPIAPQPIAPQPIVPQPIAPSPLSSNTYYKFRPTNDWNCLSLGNTFSPLKVNTDGDIVCASTNSVDCMEGNNILECNNLASTIKSLETTNNLRTINCVPTAYDDNTPDNWCHIAKNYFNRVQ